ncbi:MAG: gamma-glutamyl-gamma-aminobutyrate hydrolase family protein [Phycisphaerales bacterium JB063]
MHRPVIGITVDNRDNSADTGQYESAVRYSRAVADAGGLPVLLPHEVELASMYVARCDALVLTGGADPVMEQFGCATDGRARRMDQRRQAFELALLHEVDQQRDQAMDPYAGDIPVLGICLGMQLMALHNGASLDQYMPDTIGEDATRHHTDNARHALILDHTDSVLTRGHAPDTTPGEVVSSHRQRIADPGRLRVAARAEDGTIEAIDDPARRYYLGVQWHPERGEATDCPMLCGGVIKALVQAADKRVAPA